MVATRTQLSQISHGLDGRHGTITSIPDTQQDADLRFWIAEHWPDLVFRSGTMHVVSTAGTLLSGSVNPHSCLFTGTQQFTWDVTGGTGQFDDATGSFTGTASAVALLARNPDGSCSLTPLPFPRHEVDKFAESGTLSF